MIPQFSETSWIVTISILGGVAVAWAIVVCVITVAKIMEGWLDNRPKTAETGLF
jgi:hypothetical protein